jgi:hypothetical protein
MSTPRCRALIAATSRSRQIASPAPRARARGLARMTSSTSPSWGQNHHQQGPRSHRDPWWTSSLSEPPMPLTRVAGHQRL